jgi:hypothetical protein
MRSRFLRTSVLAVLAVGVAPAAMAIEPIPSTPGWRGFVLVGIGYTDVNSNLVAGNGLVDVGRPEISSIFQNPRSDSAVHPVFTGEVNYTFESGWQAFLGTSLEDIVTLDSAAQLGVRRQIGDNGTLQAGMLLSAVPVEVWADPYAENVKRKTTDRDSRGLRLQWDRIMGTGAELTFSWRDVQIDDEKSGQGVTSVSCDADCQNMLRRSGDFYALNASWLFRLGEGRNHLVRPMLRYVWDQSDGAAIAGDAWRAQLSYAYATPGYTIVATGAYGQRNRDEANPLYGRRTDSNQGALELTCFYRLPFESGRWQAVGGVLWGDDDSDVNFQDSEVTSVSLALLYRFGARSQQPEPQIDLLMDRSAE